MKKSIRFAALPLMAFLLAAAAPAVDEGDTAGDVKGTDGKGTTGLPLPRFASLRVNEINLRTGPGQRYPILWVFKRQGMPVEITAEYEMWRRVRDADGDEGWVHKNALSGKRAALITAKHDLLRSDDEKSGAVAHLEAGVTAQLISCRKEWCKLKADGVKGWLKKGDFWGTYPNEVFD